MNPEPDSAADDVAPQELPAAGGPAQPVSAAKPTAPEVHSEDADAPITLPDPLHEMPVDAPLAAPLPAPNAEPIAPAPDLSPAATGARLAALFPALFVGPDGKGTWKPIKLRIHADIQARAPGQFSKRTLGIFFARYTTTTAYLKVLAAPGAQRCDLDGQPAGEIAEEHRSAAAEEVARRQAIAAERRATFRPPRREAALAAEGNAPVGARHEGRPSREPGPQPERRPDNVPAARPPMRQQEGGPRLERPRPSGADSPRPPGMARPDWPPRRADHPPHAAHTLRPERRPPTPRAEPAATLPIDPAQRERALLLRAFEASPLSKANFCALKRITQAALDAALAQAQAERGAAPTSSAQRGGSAR